MPAISCYCEKCGKNFFAKDEMYGPAKKNVFRSARKIEEPASWEEWSYISLLIVLIVDCQKYLKSV